jgi:L-iditol 2-dehydrogenase
VTAGAPEQMRAAIWSGPGLPLHCEWIPTPRIEAPDQVLLRVRAAVFGAALVRAVTVGHPKWTPPAVLGSLVAGEVVAVGGEVRRLLPGMRVTLDPHPPCGRCPACQGRAEALCTARPSLTPGAHAEYVRIGPLLADAARQIPDGLPYRSAVLTESVACVVEAVSHCGDGDRVAVLGSGPMALLLARLARWRGAREVVAIVKHPHRHAAFEAAGATALGWREGGLAARVREAMGGSDPDVVFEAVGRAETYALALEIARPGGTVVAFGGCPPGTTLALDPNLVHYRGLRLIGSYRYAPGRFAEALQLLAEGQLDLAPILTHAIGLERVAEAPALAAHPDCLVLTIHPAPEILS